MDANRDLDTVLEVARAEKSVLARAAAYAAASMEGREQSDAAFRTLGTALAIYAAAIRADERRASEERANGAMRIVQERARDRVEAAEERERALRADIHRALAGARYRGEALVVSTLEYILRGEKSALLIPENAGEGGDR